MRAVHHRRHWACGYAHSRGDVIRSYEAARVAALEAPPVSSAAAAVSRGSVVSRPARAPAPAAHSVMHAPIAAAAAPAADSSHAAAPAPAARGGGGGGEMHNRMGGGGGGGGELHNRMGGGGGGGGEMHNRMGGGAAGAVGPVRVVTAGGVHFAYAAAIGDMHIPMGEDTLASRAYDPAK